MQLNPSTDFYDEERDYMEEDEPESLPDPRALTQAATTGEEDEEEDMGFDEDDERIAITVERPKDLHLQHSQEDNNDFMNEQGSGQTNYGRTTFNRYKSNNNDHRFRLDYFEKYHRKQQKTLTDSASTDEVSTREGSGNFANDDEDGNDDDDDFFNSKRKTNNRYFRKNTNDAIKIISTPLGKVGIVYQQTPSQTDEKKHEVEEKKATTFTDFDALSPDPESSHRLASSHPKITPVLTPDGKVALLYRGDSENSKYEPIRNITHKFASTNQNTTIDNKVNTTNKKITKINYKDGFSDRSNDNNDSINEEDTSSDDVNGEEDNPHNTKSNNDASETVRHLPASIIPPTTGSFIVRPTDSVLPMINRPLSEVLGIKKNQFTQFRVKDTATSTTTETPSRLLAAGPGDEHSDTTILHFLTKVNLADYPTSARTRNFDFDFSRDNTMLDERTRHKGETQQQNEDGENNQNHVNSIANEEVLSKTEVVNLAIIPHFDEDLERLQRTREHEIRRHHQQRHNRQKQKQSDEELSGIHCIMQAMMFIAAISTIFGMLGTFFKQTVLNQIRLMHW